VEEYIENNKKHTISKIMQIFLLIFIVPVLVIASFSVIIMTNTKNMGGYPSLFGNTVIQIEEGGFYNPISGMFSVGGYEMFKAGSDYKRGDIIAYYSEPSENEPIAGEIIWEDITSELNSNDNSNIATTFEETTDVSAVGIGKIGNIGRLIVANSQEFVCYSLYSSNDDTSDQDTVILLIDIIGVSIESNEFIKSFMVYCSSFDSFITLVLIPCVLLFALNLVSVILRRSYDKEEFYGQKQIIRQQEIERENMMDDEGGGKRKSIFSRMISNRPYKEKAYKYEDEVKQQKPVRVAPERPTNQMQKQAPQRPAIPGHHTAPKKPTPQHKIPQRPIKK